MVKKKLAILAAEDIEKKKKDEAEENAKNVTAKDVADKFGVQLTTNDTGRKTTPGVNPVNNVVNATKQKVQALYQQKVADLVSRATAYAKQGSDYTLDLANSIINGAITSPGKGNTGKLDIDAIHDMTKANSEISRALSESGIFNIREIATNPVYAHLATQDYRTSLLPVLQDELTASLEADKANDAAVAEYESALRTLRADYTKQAETAAQWKDFFSLVGEEATLEDKLRAAGIATGETYDRSVFAGMDKYSAYAKKKELDDWYASLDAAALSAAPVVEEPEAPKYDSKTAGIQDEISTLEKYLNAHQKLEELTAYARSNPDFATASAYTAPDYSSLSAWEQFLMPQIGGAYADNALYTYINTGDVDPYFSQSTESADYYKQWEELGYDYMLDQDKEIWNVLRTMDPAKADEYLQALSQIYLLPTRAQGYRSWDETVATNGLTAVPAWIGSVGRGIDNILSVPQQMAETWAGVDNPYSAAFDSLNRQGYTRGAQLGAIQEAEMPEWMKTVAEYAYQGVSGAADNTARLLATGMNPTAALIAAGLQSASGSLHESSERDDVSGAAKIVKAIGAGAIEVGTEKIGLDALFDKGKSGALQYLKGVVLSEMGEETLNALSEPALEAVVAYLFDHEAEIKSGPEFFKDLTDTAITTAISSLLMGGGGAINQTITNRQTGKTVTEQGDPERMVEIAKAMDPNSEVYQIATKIETSTKKGQKIPLGKLGRLTQEMGKVLGEQYADLTNGVMNDAIANRLVEVGSTPEKARRNADAIRKIGYGLKVTVQERAGLIWDKYADQVAREVAQGMHTITKGVNNLHKGVETIKQGVRDAVNGITERSNNSKAVNEDVWGNQLSDSTDMSKEGAGLDSGWVEDAKQRQQEQAADVMKRSVGFSEALRKRNDVPTVVQEAVKRGGEKVRKGKNGEAVGKENSFHISYDIGDSKTGEGELQRVKRSEDGQMQLVIKDGNKEVEVDIDSYTTVDGEGTATLIEAIKHIDDNLHHVSDEEANAMLQSYKAQGGDAARFVESYETLYLRGYSGVADDTNLPATDLDGTLAKIAVDSGKRQAEKDEQQRKERASDYKAVENPTVGWLGRVDSNAQVKGQGDAQGLEGALESLTEVQRMTAEASIAFGKAVGLNVVLFESDPDHVQDLQNGSFDESTHTVYLDVNAGAGSGMDVQTQKNNGTLGYAMMRTMSHELTHYLEVASPEMYAKYKAAVRAGLKAAGKETDMAVLIREKIDRALNAGRKMSYKAAEAEVIADASEYMLKDSKFTNDLDPTLKGKIKTFIQNFAQKVKEIFNHLTGSHKESAALREMKDGVYHYMEGLQDLWDAGFDEIMAKGTGEQSSGATEMVEGQEVKNSDRDQEYFDNIAQHDGIVVVQVPKVNVPRYANGGIDKAQILTTVRNNPLVDTVDGRYVTFCDDIDGYVELNADGIKHGFGTYASKNKNVVPTQAAQRNARAAMLLPELLQNAVEVNRSNKYSGNGLDYGHVLMAVYAETDNAGNAEYYATRIVVEHNNTKESYDLVEFGVVGQLHAVNAKKMQPSQGSHSGVAVTTTSASSIASVYSIADLITDVKDKFGDTFSAGAYQKAGLTRKNTDFSQNLMYSDRDLPSDITVRDYLAELKPTDRMNETEKILLKRYQETLGKLREAEKKASEQNEIIKTATGDELTKAKNRWQIYRRQADRYARELARAERAEGFAGMLATGQQLVDKYLTGGYTRIADASDELDEEIKGIEKNLKTIGATLHGAEQAQKNAHARGLFNQTELNAAAKQLKDSYASRMSVKEIANRLALAYGEIYADNGAEGAKRFADAAKELAQDIVYSSKYRYRSETLSLIAEEVPVISLTETDKQEIKNAGLTISQYKRGIAPFVKVAEGASDLSLSSYVSNAEAYGGQIANILGTDTEGNLAMTLYNVIQAERSSEQAGTFEGMTEGESISSVMVDIMSANLPMTTDSTTLDYLRKEMLKQAGTSQAAAKAVEDAIQSAKTATRKASSLWHRAVQEVQLSEDVIDYYRALDEQRRLMELAEQKKALSEQLKTDAAKKVHEQVAKAREEMKERQMDLNAMRAMREKNEKTKKRIKTVVKRLDNLIRNETDQKHVPEGFKPVVEEMVRLFINDESIEVFGSIDTEQGQRAVAKAYVAYEQLRNMDGEDVNQMSEFYDAEMEDTLKDLSLLLKKLNAESNLVGTERLRTQAVFLEGIEEIVSNINHISQNIGEIILNDKKASMASITSSLRTQLEKKPNYRELAGAGQTVQGAAQAIKYGNMTPVYFFRELGLDKLSDLADDLFAAEDKYGILFAKAQEDIRDIVNRHNYWAWINDEDLTFKTKQGIETKKEDQHTITMSKSEAMVIWATWKREHQGDALIQTNHISNGGVVFGKRQNGIWVETDTTAHKLSELDMRTIDQYLTDEQKAFADEFVDFLTQLGQTLGNETSMELYGFKKFKDGYYFPITVDRGQLAQKSDAGHGATDDSRIKHMSSSRKRINNASNAVLIGDFLDIGTRHVQQMLTYHCYAVPVENMNRVLNAAYNDDSDSRTTIRKMIGQKYGEEAISYLERFIADMNGGVKSDKVEKGFGKLVSLFKKSAVVNSLSVAIQQPTSIIRAMMEINPKYFVPFVGRDANTQLAKEWEQLKKHSGVAVLKEIGGFDMTKSGGMAQALVGNMEDGFSNFQMMKLAFTIGAPKGQKIKTAGRQWDKAFGFLASKADQVAWAYMWRVVKAETHAKNPEMDVNSDEFLDLAGDRYNEVMRLTQVYDSTMARSQNMRSDSQFMKMLTAFGAEGTLTANMLYDAIRTKKGKTISKAFGIFFASQIVTSAFSSLIKAGRDDDEEKTWAEKYLAAMGNALGGWSGALNPLALLPGVRDIMSLLDGYDIERSDMTIAADLVKEAEKLINGKYKDDPWKGVENVGGRVASAFGIPFKNMMRDARSLWNTATGLLAPPRKSNAMVMTKDALDNFSLNLLWEPDTSVNAYYAKLYEATLKKETKLQEDLKEYLGILGKDDKAIKTGVRKVVKEKFLDGDLTEEQAKKILLDNGWADDEKKAFTYVDEWRESIGNEDDEAYNHSVYNTVYEAALKEDNAGIKTAVDELVKNGWEEKKVRSQLRTHINEQYMDGAITQAQVKSIYKKYCLPDDFDKDDSNEWYWLFKKLDYGKANGGSTEGWSNYNALKEAFATGNKSKIWDAWRELAAHGYKENTVTSYVRTNIIKQMLLDGDITTAQATSMLRTYASYEKDSDNVDKPKEWLANKK